MKARRVLMILVAAILLVGLSRAAAAAPAAARPNVLVVLTDDQGYADVGFQGSKDIPTPHLDRLARSGVRCTNGYVSHPFCSPSRAGLMTGRYQQRFGHENNPAYDPKLDKVGLPLEEVILPQVLKQAGYVTGHIGKWHLGAAPHFRPTQRGFSESFGFLGGGHDYFRSWMEVRLREYFIPLQRNGQPELLKGYLTDELSREAVAFVRRHAAEPFFLYLAYNAPHVPLQVPEKYLSRVAGIQDPNRQKYAAMVCAIDDGAGLLLSTLRELGLDEHTLIFFLSDNGGPIAEHSNGSSNEPLRDGKGSVYEGGIRVPFVVRWPGTLPAGTVCQQPVISLDIFPTAVAAAGATLPTKRPIDGVNLLPLLKGQQSGSPHDVLFWRWGGGPAWAVRSGPLKLVKPRGKEVPQLFDLSVDIGEKNDLAAQRPQKVDELRKKYEGWNSQLIPPLWQNPRRPAAKRVPQR